MREQTTLTRQLRSVLSVLFRQKPAGFYLKVPPLPTARLEGADPHGQSAAGKKPGGREGRGQEPQTPPLSLGKSRKLEKQAEERKKKGKKQSKFTHLLRFIPGIFTDSRSYAAADMPRCSAGRRRPLERPGRGAGGSPPPPPAPLSSPGGPASSSRWPGRRGPPCPAPLRAGRRRGGAASPLPPHRSPHTQDGGGGVLQNAGPPQSAARAPSQRRVVFPSVYFNFISYK